MVFKRLITVLIFSLAITSISLAQKSAQATMKVQVRVVEGNAIAHHSGAHSFNVLEVASGSGTSELTSMKFSKSNNCQASVEKPDLLRLQNEKGEILSIPISYLENGTATGSTLQIKAGWTQDEILQKKRGLFKGELVTSVAYQ